MDTRVKVVFTAIFGDYDKLAPIREKNWRCICFTDSEDLQGKGWEIIYTKPEPKIFRKIKTCPHLFLPKHDISVWLDGNISPKMPMDHITRNRTGFYLMQHPQRKSVFAEAQRCKELNKDNHEIIDKQVAKYKKQGYKDDNGMYATGVIIRDGKGFEKFGEAWYAEIRDHSVRDQISFPVVAQKHKLKIKTFPFLQGFAKVVHFSKMR